MPSPFWLAPAAVAVLMLVTWVASLAAKDASLVDRIWGLGFALVAGFGWATGAGPLARRSLVLALVAIWGLRLSIHITRRNWGHGEDYRYQAMRQRHPTGFAAWSLVSIFGLQGVLMLLIALPILVAQEAREPMALSAWDAAGSLLWATGFAIEATADQQLARFRGDPANQGRVLDSGLWRYSRHPNYFGDAVLWWGIFVIALGVGGWWTVVSPIVMTILLMRVSGVPLLETRLQETRPAYRDYVARTSAFVPWPPKPPSSGPQETR